jgi:DNA adenine methylase
MGRSFGTSRFGPARFDMSKLLPLLDDVHDRLTSVVIERKPWGAFLEQYDGPGTLFYLDPPYWGNETDYGTGIFDQSDFQAIATRLASLKGRFLMSLNDRREVRETFKAFRIRAVKVNYSINGRAPKPFKEVLISNLEGF